jgi:hypothetical protein
MTTKAKQGMRIHVFSPDKTEDWGIGTIIDVVDLVDEDTGILFGHDFPIIQLDDGREITGLDCWWHPVTENKV